MNCTALITLAVCTMAAGCSTQAVYAHRDRVRSAAAEIQANQTAQIVADDGKTYKVHSNDMVDVRFLGEKRLFGLLRKPDVDTTMSLGQLTRGCDEEAADCVLDRSDTRSFLVGEKRVRDPEKIQKGIGYGFTSVALTGVFGYCVAECENPATATLGAVALVSYLLLIQGLSAFHF